MKKVMSNLTRAAERRLSTAKPVRFHVKAEAPQQPRVEPPRWDASTAAPGWVAFHALVHRPGVEGFHEAMQAREFPGTTYDVSFKELAALWDAWYEPRKGTESFSVGWKASDFLKIKMAEKTIDPLEGPTAEHRQARNALFDRLAQDVSEDLYRQVPRLDKSTTALVQYKPAAAMQALQLRDGTEVWLRPLEGADAYQFDQFLNASSVSEASFETRFPHADPSPSMREKLAAQLARHADEEQGHAVQDSTGRILAHLDLKQLPYGRERMCEFDILVADSVQGKGLGAALVHEAINLAAQEGYSVLRATVSNSNGPMLKLLTNSGFKEVDNMFAPVGFKSYDFDLRPPERQTEPATLAD